MCPGSALAQCGRPQSESRDFRGRAGTRATVLRHHAVGKQPLTVQTAARKRPVTGDLETAIDNLGLARGVNDPAPIRLGPGAYSASKRWRGSKANSITASAPIITVQPVDPSARASASKISSLEGVDFQSVMAARNEHPEASRGYEIAQKIVSSSRAASISGARAMIDGASSEPWRPAFPHITFS